MTAPLTRFSKSLEGVDSARVEAHLVAVIEAVSWLDPYDVVSGERPGDLLLASTFGETVHESVEVVVGRFTVRYPGPGQQRAAGLHLVDVAVGLHASIADLGRELVDLNDPDAVELGERLSLAAACADQPDGRFRWESGGISQAYRVVGEVEAWPGQIQLQAARRYEPEIRIGDELWLAGRELLPVCWVLDWLRQGRAP